MLPIRNSAKPRSRATVKQLGRLDVLVNNAAFQEHVMDFADLTEAHFEPHTENQSLRLFPYGAGDAVAAYEAG